MTRSTAEAGVMALCEELLAAWNRRDAAGMASLYAPQGSQVERFALFRERLRGRPSPLGRSRAQRL
jgi:uncharacterized protein (TIGR02246 family)